MTIEEIIKKLEGPEPIDTPTADAILDLLRAGQEMRTEAVRLADKVCWDGDEDLWRHILAWDAATGGGE